jgi:hypothetical protein
MYSADEADRLSDGVLDLPTHAKVGDLYLALLVEQNVLRLDVAMDEVQLFVDVIEAVQQLKERESQEKAVNGSVSVCIALCLFSLVIYLSLSPLSLSCPLSLSLSLPLSFSLSV